MANRLISLNVSTDGAEDYFKTFQTISELATDLDKSGDFRYVSVSANRIDGFEDDDNDELVYTEHTMFRVRKAISTALSLRDGDGPITTEIINELQNAGILFRERR